jgi:CheY-like chemotaxis protein
MPRILIVDDTEEVRELYADHLSTRGYDVLQAVNGEEALEASFSDRPTLIIMDLDMPVMDGWTAIRILKNDARTKDVPIIVLTGNQTRRDLRAARAAGATTILTKPSTFREMRAAIAAALGDRSVWARSSREDA